MSANETSPNGSPKREMSTTETDKGYASAPKRKASSSQPEDKHSQSPKRTRLDDDAKQGKPTTAAPTSKEPSRDRRETAIQEEKKRGKRLFGGLLSTLSQTTSSSQQKRRQEIERRQQAKAHQQRAEDDKRREEKLAKLKAVRKAEQLKFDEQVMRTKHSNMLATARFLKTKSTPEIYYSPWDPTAEQERTIKDQIREAKDIIDKEVLDFKRHKEQRMKTLGIAAEPETLEPKDTVGSKPDAEPLTDLPQSNPTNHSPLLTTGKAGYEKEPDKADDVMIEEVEDTVIY
ncbi:pinin/SDK/memA/ protein conserved region-domain-containing protein [Hypoxylon cercidicola]|nr:pinin/SDK/memA/ protein conserved region-domain-containing protein [Hypoxylon cercidicola]